MPPKPPNHDVEDEHAEEETPKNHAAAPGVAAVEFALLVPLLVAVFVGVVDFARVFYFSETLWNCARQGALYASDPVTQTNSPYTSVTQAALADATNLTPQPSVSSVTTTDSAGHNCVRVTVTGQFSTLMGVPSPYFSVTMTRTVEMRIPGLPQ